MLSNQFLIHDEGQRSFVSCQESRSASLNKSEFCITRKRTGKKVKGPQSSLLSTAFLSHDKLSIFVNRDLAQHSVMFKSMASLLSPAMVSYKGRFLIGPDDPKGSNPDVNSDALPDDHPHEPAGVDRSLKPEPCLIRNMKRALSL